MCQTGKHKTPLMRFEAIDANEPSIMFCLDKDMEQFYPEKEQDRHKTT